MAIVKAEGKDFSKTVSKKFPSTQFCYYISMMIGQSILELTGVSFNWLMILLGLIAFSSIIVDLSAELFKYIKIFK